MTRARTKRQKSLSKSGGGKKRASADSMMPTMPEFPEMPAPEPIAPPPTTSTADADFKALDLRRMMRRRRGLSSMLGGAAA